MASYEHERCLPRVDEVRVLLSRVGVVPLADDADFSVQEDFALHCLWQAVGDQSWNAAE